MNYCPIPYFKNVRFFGGRSDGLATYFYSDGRIKSKGQWHDYAQIGIWKDYKENGELQATSYYDSTVK